MRMSGVLAMVIDIQHEHICRARLCNLELRAPARVYLTLRNPNPKSGITCTTTYRRVQITHLMRMRHALGTVIDIQH